MTYTDAQGRPEIVMHPDVLRGTAGYRTVKPAGTTDAAGNADPAGNAVAIAVVPGQPVPADSEVAGPRPRPAE